MSEFPPAGVHRQKLDVATRDLENAAEAISAALGIDAAKVAASLGSRVSALKLLKGRDILKGTQEGRRGSVVKKRMIDTRSKAGSDDDEMTSTVSSVRPKRRSGRSK